MQKYYPVATVLYAICLGSLVLLVIIRSLLRVTLELVFPQVAFIWKARQAHEFTLRIRCWLAEHLKYKPLLSSGRSLSRSFYILFSLYLTGNLCCILIQAPDVATIGARSGHVAVINCLLLSTGPSLNFAADLSGFPLRVQKQIHAAAGYMVGITTVIHTFTALSTRQAFPVKTTENLCAILGLVAVLLLLPSINVLSKRLPRLLPYEILLSIHHLLPYLLGAAVWRHLPQKAAWPRLCIYIILGVFSVTFLIQLTISLYRSRCRFHCARFTSRPGIVEIIVYPQRPVRITPGQYISFWTPTSIGSVFQSHPLTVASWGPGPQEFFLLYAQVQKGFTHTLHKQLQNGEKTAVALFTGPHGRTLPLNRYDHVVMVATDMGATALVPYLQWLAHCCHSIQSRTKRVHLIWCLTDWDLILVLGYLINKALEGDEPKETKDRTWSRDQSSVLKISLYGNGHETDDTRNTLGEYESFSRVVVHRGLYDLKEVLDNEIVAEDSSNPLEKPSVVAASIRKSVRTELESIIRPKLRHVDLMYTDYQPED